MAMIVKDGKLYIMVADSDAIVENKISVSNNDKTKVTTNYCPPDKEESRNKVFHLLGNLARPVYSDHKKVKEYHKMMKYRIQNKYSSLFVGKMDDFENICSLFETNDKLIANKLFLTGERPYLQFDGGDDWKSFKKLIYGEVTSIVIEPKEGKFVCYPEFHPLFIKQDDLEEYIDDTSVEVNNEIKYNGVGKNLVVYGTPGCGKSYYVQHKLLEGYPKDGEKFDTVVRTTFYQDYTNTDFVGQLLPHLEKDDNGKETVTYAFNPGPFTIALKMAFDNPDKPVALVIEELNRGNAASIFGDIFQLLDRSASGESEYEIHNINIQDYLNRELKDRSPFECVKIPSNLSIFATMNTSDQNVFTLDTAFKRRWEFKKLPNEFNEDHPYADYLVPGMKMDCNWYAIVKAINKYIVMNKNSLTSEDKQIGVFFVKDNILIDPKNGQDDAEKTKKFAYKMIEYLWNDVAKYSDRSEWFNGAETLDEALKNYEDNGNKAFNKSLIEKIKEYMQEYEAKTKKQIEPEEGDNNAQ